MLKRGNRGSLRAPYRWKTGQPKGAARGLRRTLSIEQLEDRCLLATDLVNSAAIEAKSGELDPAPLPEVMAAGFHLTTTGSSAPVYLTDASSGGGLQPDLIQSRSLINMNAFRVDPRFTGIDGHGYSSVIIDTGIDLNHPFFGPDANSNGIADRIVYQYDFSGSNDSDASDVD